MEVRPQEAEQTASPVRLELTAVVVVVVWAKIPDLLLSGVLAALGKIILLSLSIRGLLFHTAVPEAAAEELAETEEHLLALSVALADCLAAAEQADQVHPQPETAEMELKAQCSSAILLPVAAIKAISSCYSEGDRTCHLVQRLEKT
jgi:hypothetical protein